MSESKPSMNSSRWLYGTKVGGKEAQKSDLGKSESKAMVSTNRRSWSDEGRDSHKSDFGKSCSVASMQGKLVSRRLCSRLFRTMAQLKWRGESYNISIDCDTSEWKMLIKVESRVAVNVEHLVWNFRGIKKFDTGSVSDPVEFEVVWDVEDWLFDKPMTGQAIFMFRNPCGINTHISTVYTSFSRVFFVQEYL
ncbi:hypothetical protein SUGI_0288740 [Cryptomeria japonica]|nr:hypothetical protein SUGI_0288740 [Cryptomeria japonica]